MARGVALVGGSIAACAPDRSAGPAEPVGVASQEQAPAYCVFNAHTDVGTVHFQGPDWLLTSSEGRGPLELDVRVEQYVQPSVSTSVDVKLNPSTLSKAVGYNMAERYLLQGAARQSLMGPELKRLEAYTAYQRTVWEIRDASCAVPLGAGASFRPIGLYFRVVLAADITLPQVGVHLVTPGDAIPAGP